jgi:hypothetical protein
MTNVQKGRLNIIVGRDHLLGNLGTAAIKPAHYVQMNPSWEDELIHMGNIFPAFYGTRRFITVILNVRHWTLSSA